MQNKNNIKTWEKMFKFDKNNLIRIKLIILTRITQKQRKINN